MQTYVEKEHFHPNLSIKEVNEYVNLMFDGELSDFEGDEFDGDLVKHVPNTLIVGKKLWCCFKANRLQCVQYV